MPQIEPSQPRSQIVSKRKMFLLVGLVTTGIFVIYLIALVVWNVRHSPTATLDAFSRAVSQEDAPKVTSMLDESRSLPEWEIKGFINYYSSNRGTLDTLLAPLHSQNHSSVSMNMNKQSGEEQISLVKYKNAFGFTTYRIHIPTVSYTLTSPNNVSFHSYEETVPTSGIILPGKYNITATTDTLDGPVSDTEMVDTTNGSDTVQRFDFAKDMVRIHADITGPVNILADGKLVGQTNAPRDGSDFDYGPLPLYKVKRITVRGMFDWGDYDESGPVIVGHVIVTPEGANDKLAAMIADVVNHYRYQEYLDAKAGSYQKQLQYLAPDGPLYQTPPRHTFGSGGQYLGMNYSTDLRLISITPQNPGIALYAPPTLDSQGPMVSFMYLMEYDHYSQKWFIYDVQLGDGQMDENAPVVHLDTPS